jgi:hypothetical protein
MLHRQIAYLTGKFWMASKFRALIFVWQRMKAANPGADQIQTSPSAPFLTAPTDHFTIHLESAAFVFHINGTTLRIIRSLRAACSEPVQRFLACPFS